MVSTVLVSFPNSGLGLNNQLSHKLNRSYKPEVLIFHNTNMVKFNTVDKQMHMV